MATPVYVAAPKEDNGKKDVQNASQNSFMAGSSNMTGTGITVLKEGEIAEYRKYGNGKDTSDDLAVAGDAQQVAKQRGNTPKREKDLHPSGTYQGDGDEVDESEWD